jgi:hypothetical protein
MMGSRELFIPEVKKARFRNYNGKAKKKSSGRATRLIWNSKNVNRNVPLFPELQAVSALADSSQGDGGRASAAILA